MAFAIKFTDPKGIVSYMPEGFGFTCHSHVTDIADSWKLNDRSQVEKILNGYIRPNYFWNSEREHALRMEAKFHNWKCEVVDA